MIEMGLIVAIGLITMFCKLSWKRRMWMLSHPLALDIAVFVLVNFLHYGTYSGMMVAAISALTCSACIGLGRKAFGYIERGKYQPGWISISHKL
jgi:hypothetical protein